VIYPFKYKQTIKLLEDAGFEFKNYKKFAKERVNTSTNSKKYDVKYDVIYNLINKNEITLLLIQGIPL